jgi:hypothetical protein
MWLDLGEPRECRRFDQSGSLADLALAGEPTPGHDHPLP